MRENLLYVELKTGYSHDGPAWISVASTSKSGATIYSNGKAFKSLKGSGISANYYDLETGEEYWISGIKKNALDRHRNGGGIVKIDRDAIPAYLEATGFSELPNNLIEAKLDPSIGSSDHHEIEHRKLSQSARKSDFVRAPTRNSIVKSKH